MPNSTPQQFGAPGRAVRPKQCEDQFCQGLGTMLLQTVHYIMSMLVGDFTQQPQITYIHEQMQTYTSFLPYTAHTHYKCSDTHSHNPKCNLSKFNIKFYINVLYGILVNTESFLQQLFMYGAMSLWMDGGNKTKEMHFGFLCVEMCHCWNLH